MKNKRLKKHHQQALKPISDFTCDLYPNLRNYYYRKIRTKQEKAVNYQHRIECFEMGVKVKIRSKRCENLADGWDDIPSFFHDMKKCWKHNSKRAHQYYKEKRA